MIGKVINPSFNGVYSACKSHVFKRNQSKGRPKTSILATATYERKFRREKTYEEK